MGKLADNHGSEGGNWRKMTGQFNLSTRRGHEDESRVAGLIIWIKVDLLTGGNEGGTYYETCKKTNALQYMATLIYPISNDDYGMV